MIDNNYAMVDNSYVTMLMRRLPIMTRQKLRYDQHDWTLLYLLNHEQCLGIIKSTIILTTYNLTTYILLATELKKIVLNS